MTAKVKEKEDMPRASHFSFSKGWLSRRPESSNSWSWNWELSGRNKNLNLTCSNGTHHNSTLDCVEGLGMTPAQFNLPYAIYTWINAVVVILAGFLIDKLGNRFFALGSHFKGSPYLLSMMLTGRLLFDSGNGSLTSCSESYHSLLAQGEGTGTGIWTMSFSCLGSVLNFFTQQFESLFGMQWTLWGGTLLYVLGFVSALTVSVLDKVGTKQLGLDGVIQQESKVGSTRELVPSFALRMLECQAKN